MSDVSSSTGVVSASTSVVSCPTTVGRSTSVSASDVSDPTGVGSSTKPRIAILTFVVGADYRRDLAACLQSKRDYAARHGYTYVEAGEEFWDRDRPIAWSKVLLWLDFLRTKAADFDYIWASDADVLITNPALKLEDHVLPLLPASKSILWNHDACRNLNSGNMIFRCSEAAWLIEYFERVWNNYTSEIYHIHWENRAMILEWTNSQDVRNHMESTKEHWRFNAYLGGRKGERIWKQGDFLVHFAGVYDTKRMNVLINDIKLGKTPRVNFFPNEMTDDELQNT